MSILTLVLAAMLACCCGKGPPSQGGAGVEPGTLRGIVLYRGTPCPETATPGPPCDGPYPEYDVIVLEAGSDKEAARVRSGPDGRFEITLPTGDYRVLTRVSRSLAGEKLLTYSPIRVEAGQASDLKIVIDVGVR